MGKPAGDSLIEIGGATSPMGAEELNYERQSQLLLLIATRHRLVFIFTEPMRFPYAW